MLGAGFAGLRAALDLPRRLKGVPHQVTLVDRSDTHLYTPDLYEIASAFEPEVTHACQVKLKDTVATPLRSLLSKTPIVFLQDWVQTIDPKKKRVLLRRQGWISYDVLVVTLGSVPSFFNIPGLEAHAYPLKTIRDALAIQSNLDQLLQRTSLQRKKPLPALSIVVGGGGPAGVELVCELAQYLKCLIRKYRYPASRISLHLVEGGEELAGLGPKGTRIALHRLKALGIRAHLGRFIVRASSTRLTLKMRSGLQQSLPCQFLIWTGGVEVNPVIQASVGKTDCRGAIPVNDYLQSVEHSSIFAAGDNILLWNRKTGRPFPMLAQFAWMQGMLLARNVRAFVTKQPLKKISLHPPILVVPMGGHYGILKIGRWVFHGRRVWLLHRLVSLRYALTLLPFWKAYRKWKKDTAIFAENG